MSNLEFFAKAIDTKTFKQHQQERLLIATFFPASELAKLKQEEEGRVKAFTRAAADVELVNKIEDQLADIAQL